MENPAYAKDFDILTAGIWVALVVLLWVSRILPGGTEPKWRNRFLLAGSLVFFAAWNIESLLVLFICVGLTWACQIFRETPWENALKWLATFLFLCAFFGLHHSAFNLLHRDALVVLGLRFYLLNALAFVWAPAERAAPRLALSSLLLSLSYFPVNFAGPLISVRKVAAILQEKNEERLFPIGTLLLFSGFFRVFVVAGNLSYFYFISQQEMPFKQAYILMFIACAFVYAEVSGVVEFFRGISYTLGIRVPKTFDRPYLSTDAAEFWTRWNSSVASWVRDNVFFRALVLSRSTLFSIFFSYFLITLWHGLSWQYLMWGIAWILIGLVWRPNPIWKQNRWARTAQWIFFLHLAALPLLLISRSPMEIFVLVRKWIVGTPIENVMSAYDVYLAGFMMLLLLVEEPVTASLEKRITEDRRYWHWQLLAYVTLLSFIIGAFEKLNHPQLFYL